MAVDVSPLRPEPTPGSLQLCQAHLDRLKLPQGWTLIRRDGIGRAPFDGSDILALANEIRRVGGIEVTDNHAVQVEHSLSSRTNLVMLTSRAHLRVVADASEYAIASGQ